MNPGTAHVIRANARALPLADDSVDLIVTSPPYFALRSYQDGGEHYEGQIGDEPMPADFVDSLIEVTRECMRVLKPSGSLWVNLGDKYNSAAHFAPQGPGMTGGPRDKDGRRGSTVANVRPKSLVGIPWRYALRCIDDLGLILRAEVIWSKPNGLPESVTDRVRRSHEQWFHFTLNPRYFSAVDEIREPHKSEPGREGKGALGGQKTLRPVGPGSGSYNPLGALPGSVWTVPTEPLRVPDHLGVDHFAAFPTEWPKRIIQGWSPVGVCVECGEGRRPVGVSTITADRGGRQFNPASGNVGVLGKEREFRMTGYACACTNEAGNGMACGMPFKNPTHSSHDYPRDGKTLWCSGAYGTPPPTRPAVVLDPFGGTGTTAMVAKALGRHGISVDMSADYCRLAEWRTNDRDQLAKVLGIAKHDGPTQPESLLDLIEEPA